MQQNLLIPEGVGSGHEENIFNIITDTCKYRFAGSHSLHTFQTYGKAVPDPKSSFFRQQHMERHWAEIEAKENQICPFLSCSGKWQCAACSAALGLDFLICSRKEEGAGGKMRADFAVIWWELFIFPIWQGNLISTS